MNPATVLRVLGPEPWNVAYVEPSFRPDDGRYAENPNRMQMHHQYQVILKPDPGNPQELYLASLEAIGLDRTRHDIRFVEDNWESPALGAWGLGWEVWLDGQEITQFTYFQQSGSLTLDPVSVEITYGLDRIVMYLQHKTQVWDIDVDGAAYLCRALPRPGDRALRLRLRAGRRRAPEAALRNLPGGSASLYRARPGHSGPRLCAAPEPHLQPARRPRRHRRHRTRQILRRHARPGQGRFRTLRGTARAAGIPLAGRGDKRRAGAGRQQSLRTQSPARPLSLSPSLPSLFSSNSARRNCRRRMWSTASRQIGGETGRAADAVQAELRRACASTGTTRRLVAYVTDLAPMQADEVVEKRGPALAQAYDTLGQPTKALEGFARGQGVRVDDARSARQLCLRRQARRRPAGRRSAARPLPGTAQRPALGQGHALEQQRHRLLAAAALDRGALRRPGRALHLGRRDQRAAPAAARALPMPRPACPPAASRPLPSPTRRATSTPSPHRASSSIATSAANWSRNWCSGAAEPWAASVPDEPALLDEVTDLIEAPQALLGTFEARYLDLPAPVLIGVMKKHQRYFPVIKDGSAGQPFRGRGQQQRTGPPGGRARGLRRRHPRALCRRRLFLPRTTPAAAWRASRRGWPR